MGADPKRVALSVVLLGLVVYAGFQAWNAQQRPPVVYVTATPEVVASASVTPALTPTPVKTPLFSRPSKTPAPQPTTVSGDAGALLDALNRERTAQGRGALAAQTTLQGVAQAHVIDMVSQGYFDHTSPDGVTFEARIRASGYPLGVSGENLGLTTGNVLSVVSSWMSSPQHRANILDGRFTAIGIALEQGMWEGMPATFVVTVFGDVR